MRRARHIASALAVWALVGGVSAQELTPLADPVLEPLLPTGISRGDVELFGRRVYLFESGEGARVVHVVGEFELHLARRRFVSAREAVLWLTSRSYKGLAYQHFEIFLWQQARVVESGGTIQSGPVLFVTLNSTGKVTIGADDTTTASSAETSVYREGAELRRRLGELLESDIETHPPTHVVEPEEIRRRQAPEVRPPVSYHAKEFEAGRVGDRQMVTAIGQVRLFQGDSSGGDPLELRADAAVLFMAPEATTTQPATGGEPGVQEPPRDLTERTSGPGPIEPGALGRIGGDELLTGSEVEGVYLEGDVVLTRGERMIRAPQLYYDFANDRALILDAVARVIEPTRDVPVYVRAEQVRQLSRTEYAAWEAKISTSEFYSPHMHIGAKEARFRDRTSVSATGVAAGLRAGTFEAYHTTFSLGGIPLAYWPYARGDFKEGENVLRGVRVGYSKNFGGTLETEWNLFSLAAVQTPPGFDGTLRLDYYSERGPGVGVDLDYERDNYFGLYRGYYIYDDGEDSLGRFRDETPDTRNRGRSTLRHRQYLGDGWELTLEGSYISDRGFLEEYFEREFEDGKDQETLLYLKKQHDNWALTGLTQWRILDFVTQTEHLPDFTFRLIGEPLGELATFHSENRAGFVRYRPGERELLEYLFIHPREDSSGVVARGDTRQELELPVLLGPLKLVPFGAIRGSAWDDSPESGGVQRLLGTAGVRGSTYFTRDYPDLRSQLLDVDGIRHIIKADVIAWAGGSSLPSSHLYPFSPNVEDLDDVSGGAVGVRQRWQTRRGGPGQRRTVDLVTLDVEAGVFDNPQGKEVTNGYTSYSRPENSVTRNYVNAAVNYRVNDSTVWVTEANFDLNDQELDIFNTSVVVERDPRFSYLLAYRYINEIDSSLLAFGANYRISEKHTLAVRESFDLDRGKTEEFSIGLIRKFPRWYVGLTVDLNEADDDFGVSLSAWPEGLPRAALGSRRFTGLATSTGIRPE